MVVVVVVRVENYELLVVSTIFIVPYLPTHYRLPVPDTPIPYLLDCRCSLEIRRHPPPEEEHIMSHELLN